jgi:hypothetical protein
MHGKHKGTLPNSKKETNFEKLVHYQTLKLLASPRSEVKANYQGQPENKVDLRGSLLTSGCANFMNRQPTQ